MEGQTDDEFTEVEIRVRYAETDQMGFAYYSNYLVWFEVGRGSFCLQRGLSYQDMEKIHETFLPVIEAKCQYRRPLLYDQVALVRTRLYSFNRRMISFEYQITDPDKDVLFAEGMTRHVFADSKGKPRSLPDELKQYFLKT